jgi:ATP-dependent Clp protease adaptor protein ClpS
MGTPTPDLKESDLAQIQEKTTEPPLFQVLIHNDDFTPKAFVVEVLATVFNKSAAEATEIMWHTHRNGVGLCGTYPYEMAETKLAIAAGAARESGFPLRLTLEEA